MTRSRSFTYPATRRVAGCQPTRVFGYSVAQEILSVADQGVGIPADDLPHIFECFRRGGNVAGRIVGTGMVLWRSQRIVAQHGGTIVIASAEDQGTTVTVRLPLTVVAEPSDAPQLGAMTVRVPVGVSQDLSRSSLIL